MKNIVMGKRKSLLSVFLILCLVFTLSIQSMAVVSNSDKNLSSAQQAAIQQATNAYNSAAASGNTAGMNAAHEAAEAVRNSAGYSGGSDGSGNTAYNGSSKTGTDTHSSTTSASGYNNEASNTEANGTYNTTGHTALDQQNMAGLSNVDTETIAYLEDLYTQASQSGQTATADAAHAAAEALRNAYGYSGGDDGDYYISNSGSSGSSNNSGGGGGETSVGNYTFFTITASAGTGGSINPSGTTTLVKGDSKTFTITPNAGYRVSGMLVDGAPVEPVPTYTFSNVALSHTISVKFVAIFNITASAGTGGSISPSGTTALVAGSSQTYTITPNTGYKISSVTVDGASVGAVSTYTFSDVAAAHSISVTFASAASLSAGDAVLGDDGSGTLKSGNMTKSGYGVTANISVASSYVSGTTVTASYNFTSPQTVLLQNVNGTWQFPVNPSHPARARKLYIPVDAPGTASDPKTYAITFTVKALDPQATALAGYNVYLTDIKSVTLTIDGSMYEDDFTGNS